MAIFFKKAVNISPPLKRWRIYIYNTIHMYSGITSGRVLNGELLYTEILEVNLFAFAFAFAYCLYMGVYYTSVKRTQQLSGVTRIRTHDLLIRYLITKQWRPVLNQLGHHPNPKKVGSMPQLYWVELSLTSHHTQIWSCRVLLPPTSTAPAPARSEGCEFESGWHRTTVWVRLTDV